MSKNGDGIGGLFALIIIISLAVLIYQAVLALVGVAILLALLWVVAFAIFHLVRFIYRSIHRRAEAKKANELAKGTKNQTLSTSQSDTIKVANNINPPSTQPEAPRPVTPQQYPGMSRSRPSTQPIAPKPINPQPTPKSVVPEQKPKTYIIDGLNIVYTCAREQPPSLGVLLLLLNALRDSKINFICIFDASTRHKLEREGEPDSKEIYKKLLYRRPTVFSEVPGGTCADDYILNDANDKDLPVISNDRFRDYAKQFPWVSEENRLIKVAQIGGELRILPLKIAVPISKDRNLDLLVDQLLDKC